MEGNLEAGSLVLSPPHPCTPIGSPAHMIPGVEETSETNPNPREGKSLRPRSHSELAVYRLRSSSLYRPGGWVTFQNHLELF